MPKFKVISVNYKAPEITTENDKRFIISVNAWHWVKRQQLPCELIERDEQVIEGFAVPNGECRTSTGFRQVVLSGNDMIPTHIIYRESKGYATERRTFQVADETDIIISHHWGHGEDYYKVSRGGKELPYHKADEIISKLSDELKRFLKRDSRGPSYLDSYTD